MIPLAARRLLAVAVVAIIGVWGVVLVEPEPETQPVWELAGEDLATLAAAGVWYCPWAEADASRDSLLTIAATDSATALLSLPHPIPGEPADTQQVTLVEGGSHVVALSEIALRGAAPAFIEITESRSAVSSLVENEDVLAGDGCLAALPKVWHLPGGSTQEGRLLTLRLFNPFPETARVDVVAVSEFGTEPLPELAGRAVPGRSWDDIELDTKLRLRDTLSFTVSTSEGIVIPAVFIANEADEATWTGTSLSTEWAFPVTGNTSGPAVITVFNPGPDSATVEMALFTPEGPLTGPEPVVAAAGEVMQLSLTDLSEAPLGVLLTADGPIAATVVADTVNGLAATSGLDSSSTAWLLPGAGASRGLTSVWMLNPGSVDATVTVADVDGSGYLEKVALPAGALRRVPLPEARLTAVRVDATQPISVAWSAGDAQSLMFVAGTLLTLPS